jgi:chemotaxis signal transduction protein
MKYLMTRIDGKDYCIDSTNVLEVVPLVHLQQLDKRFSIQYRGETIPVFDLCLLLRNRPHQKKFSTRIILLKLQNQICGLICEGVTDMTMNNSAAENLDLNGLIKV